MKTRDTPLLTTEAQRGKESALGHTTAKACPAQTETEHQEVNQCDACHMGTLVPAPS